MANLPLSMAYVRRAAVDCGIENIGTAGIRELRRLVDSIEAETGIVFLRMEMGVPGLPPPEEAVQAEIAALQAGVGASYPPFEGIPALKAEISRFIRKFTDVRIAPQNCYPTLGAMQGCYLGMALATRRYPSKNKILFIDPGFPVNKLQAQSLGLNYTAFDLAAYRGAKLADKLEAALSHGDYAAILYANPSNPAWLCLTPEELKIIGEASRRYDVVVLEDLAYFGMDFRKDYGRPGEPPFVPTVARHTDRCLLIISSSKVFSLAGQRIGMLAIADPLATRRYAHLRRFYPSALFGEALSIGGLYAIGAGISHSAQHGLLALLAAVNDGRYRFREVVQVYGQRAADLKGIFRKHGFDLVYGRDGEEDLGDGIYFTVAFAGLTGAELAEALLCIGISALSLDVAGAARQGVRACVSQITEADLDALDRRLAFFRRIHR